MHVFINRYTHNKHHGNCRRKGPQHHDTPILPALRIIAKVDDPRRDSHLEGRNLADISPLPSGSTGSFENVIDACYVHVAKMTIVGMEIPIRASLVFDTASVVAMSYLDFIVGVVVPRLLVQNWVAPTVDGARLEEVLASFEFDRELLFRSLENFLLVTIH